MELLLLLLLAHLLSDFPLQSANIVAAKRRGLWQGYALHALTHALVAFLLTHYYTGPRIWVIWLCLPLLHAAVDWLKMRLPLEFSGLLSLAIDQALHLLLIFMAWQMAGAAYNEALLGFYGCLLTADGREVLGALLGGRLRERLLPSAVVYGYVLLGGEVLAREVLKARALDLPEKYAHSLHAGRVIGMLERAIVLTFVLAGEYRAMAFVLTAKSIARFKDLDDQRFAEYISVGTLLSVLLAMLAGLTLRTAFGLF